MASYSDNKIVDSWKHNADPWIQAIQHNEIESRALATNKAIVDAILNKSPEKVLDIGCGEGWLAKELNNAGVYVHGIDVVPELVDEAIRQGGGVFQLLSYENLSKGVLKDKFDIVVCNFSLLGNESVDCIFKCIRDLLNEDGFFIVQTLHPISGCGDGKYEDGWRKGSWNGFNKQFANPPPWYFRTLESWKLLFRQNGFVLSEVLEPLNPTTNETASIIFVGEVTSCP